MGAESKIEWTHHTFNPWIGCTKVSEGCKHCYAETQNNYRRWVGGWGPTSDRKRTSPSYWRQTLKWDREAKAAGERRRVFCASLADVFDTHPSIPSLWRLQLFERIDQTPNLDWLLLTKRPENIAGMLPFHWLERMPSNVWLGTTVENQEEAERRIPHLLAAPAALRFLSCEPLLGKVDLRNLTLVSEKPPHGPGVFLDALTGHVKGPDDMGPKVNWVIVGGESGMHARELDLGWARLLKAQCDVTRTAFFFKQTGKYFREHSWDGIPGATHSKALDGKGGDLEVIPEDLRVRQFPEVHLG